MTDAAWIKVLEDLMADAVILYAKGDTLSDKRLAEYKQRGWDLTGENWTCSVKRDE